MIEHIMQNYPPVPHILTGNTQASAPMLKINHELGFQLYKTIDVWQMPTKTLYNYLGL